MNRIFITSIYVVFLAAFDLNGQPWVQNDAVFNPSGVPSLSFSQPRFADLDGDSDFDMIIGSIDENPFYLKNEGTTISPVFTPGDDLFADVQTFDAEMGICFDIDNDGDLDFIAGGFTGLNFYENTGDYENPVFQKVDGFFSGLIVGQNPVPDLADTDADGDGDMVVGMSESGVVKIYTNTGSAASAEFSENNVEEIGDAGLYAYPVFCDLDDDGDYDLLAGRDIYGFVYYKNTGDPGMAVWETDPSVFEGLGEDTYWNSPDLVDLNGDEMFDLIFGTADGPLKYYMNTGTTLNPAWEENTSLFGGTLDPGGASNPCFYDYDDDGDLDLFTGSQLGDIIYYENIGTPNGPAWEENSSYFESLKHSIYSDVAIGDVNNDGLPDAIVGDLSGELYYHRNTVDGFVFESAALQAIALGGWSSPWLVDLDADSDLDIVAGNEDGFLAYIENQGSAQNPEWVEIPNYFGGIDIGFSCVPTLGDLDYDGDPDLLCGNISGQLQYYENQEGDWVMNTEVFQGITGGQNTAPGLADLDGDGDNDLALGQYSGTLSYYENQNPLTEIDQNTLAVTTELKAYPNPFTSNIFLKLDIDVDDVEIRVYDFDGRLVRQKQPVVQSEGKVFSLDLNDLPTGIYTILVKSENFNKSVKAVKL